LENKALLYFIPTAHGNENLTGSFKITLFHIRRFAEFADHQLCGAVPIKIDQNPFLRKKKCQKIYKKNFKTSPKIFTSLARNQ
jgi:hypothetical protein